MSDKKSFSGGNERMRRRAAGLMLAMGQVPNAQMREAGCIWDGEVQAWLVPDPITMQRLIAKGAILKKAESAAKSAARQESPPLSLPPARPSQLPPQAVPPPKAAAAASAAAAAVAAAAAQPAARAFPPAAALSLPQAASLGSSSSKIDVPDSPAAKVPPMEPAPKAAAEPAAEPAARDLRAVKPLLALPPCTIVVQEVSVLGDVRYETLGGESSLLDAGEGLIIREEVRTSKKTVTDPAEYQRAVELASKLRSSLRGLGKTLHSGVLLVPKDKDAQLEEALLAVKTRASEFNQTAVHHHVRVSQLRAALTSDVEQAARDMAYTLQKTLEDMQSALAACDVKRMREVAASAKTIIPVLPEKEAKLLGAAVDSVRQQATFIKSSLEKKELEFEEVSQLITYGPINAARMAALSYAAPVEIEAARESLSRSRFAGLQPDVSSGVSVSDDGSVQSGSRFSSMAASGSEG